MVRLLSDDDVAALLELDEVLDVVEAAFVKQGRGEVERPERPHFPVGVGLDADSLDTPLGTGLTMPAYVHGEDWYATKLADVHPGNAEKGLPTVNAQIALTDARTGQPAAYMAGTRITSARTGCIGGSAARALAIEPVTLGIIGAGTQARWQARAIAAATDVESIRVYSPSESKHDCVADLRSELDAQIRAANSPEDAIKGANVVVTATTSESPVFPGRALEAGTLVVAIGAYTSEMRELDEETFERAAQVFADVPEEVIDVGDVSATELAASDLIPLSDVFEGTSGRQNPAEILVVESVGSAVLDAATSVHVLSKAEAADVGTNLSL